MCVYIWAQLLLAESIIYSLFNEYVQYREKEKKKIWEREILFQKDDQRVIMRMIKIAKDVVISLFSYYNIYMNTYSSLFFFITLLISFSLFNIRLNREYKHKKIEKWLDHTITFFCSSVIFFHFSPRSLPISPFYINK